MLLLSELFDYLSSGEFAQLSIGGLKEGGIRELDYPRLINLTNLGLLEIYKRLPLKVRELRLDLQDGVSNYKLHTDHAYTDPNSTDDTDYPKWLIDSAANPFTDDVLFIQEVYDELGNELPLNDDYEDDSVFTPIYDTIQVPYARADITLAVIYRASPTKISNATTDPTSVRVSIPDQLIDALAAFIAYKVTAPLTDESDSKFSFSAFEASIARVKKYGLENYENTTNQKLWRKGWV